MKTKIFTTATLLTFIFVLAITVPVLACPPDDPNCESKTEVTGSIYDEFQKNHGDTKNGIEQTGSGFMNLFAEGKNLAAINGEIKSQGKGVLSPDNLSAWSKSNMKFSGTTKTDKPGESNIVAGGGVYQTSSVGKDNAASYAGAAQAGAANFEAVKTTNLNAIAKSNGDTQINFLSEANHERAEAGAQNKSLAEQNGAGNTTAYAVNQIVGGAQMGATTGQFTGNGEIGNCNVPVWTKGTGFADISQTMTPTSYTSKAQVFAREETGTGIKPE